MFTVHNHEDAVLVVQEYNGPRWGGYEGAERYLPAWINHWRAVYEANEVAILREMAQGTFDRWSGQISRNMPEGDYGKGGLYDSEGELAVADYFCLRAGVDPHV
jgi:hypothetical protein